MSGSSVGRREQLRNLLTEIRNGLDQIDQPDRQLQNSIREIVQMAQEAHDQHPNARPATLDHLIAKMRQVADRVQVNGIDRQVTMIRQIMEMWNRPGIMTNYMDNIFSTAVAYRTPGSIFSRYQTQLVRDRHAIKKLQDALKSIARLFIRAHRLSQQNDATELQFNRAIYEETKDGARNRLRAFVKAILFAQKARNEDEHRNPGFLDVPDPYLINDSPTVSSVWLHDILKIAHESVTKSEDLTAVALSNGIAQAELDKLISVMDEDQQNQQEHQDQEEQAVEGPLEQQDDQNQQDQAVHDDQLELEEEDQEDQAVEEPLELEEEDQEIQDDQPEQFDEDVDRQYKFMVAWDKLKQNDQDVDEYKTSLQAMLINSNNDQIRQLYTKRKQRTDMELLLYFLKDTSNWKEWTHARDILFPNVTKSKLVSDIVQNLL